MARVGLQLASPFLQDSSFLKWASKSMNGVATEDDHSMNDLGIPNGYDIFGIEKILVSLQEAELAMHSRNPWELWVRSRLWFLIVTARD